VTLLTAFFYLMMIVCGAAIAFILHDLKRAEDRAVAAMSRLQTDHGLVDMGQNSHANKSSHRSTQPDMIRQPSVQIRTINRLSGFLAVADGSSNTERDCAYQVQFDFAANRSTTRKEQTVVSLPVYADQSDCCA